MTAEIKTLVMLQTNKPTYILKTTNKIVCFSGKVRCQQKHVRLENTTCDGSFGANAGGEHTLHWF